MAEFEAIEVKIRKVAEDLKDACDKITFTTLGHVSAEIIKVIESKKISIHTHFETLSGGSEYITEEKLITHITSIKKIKVSGERRDMLLAHVGSKGGISRRG